MLKRYAFFPGCVLNAAASEARTALEASAELLDVELVEIPDWRPSRARAALWINPHQQPLHGWPGKPCARCG